MLDVNLQSVLDIIHDGTNPEIHHFRNGTHPGTRYYIKTIIPGPRIINDDTYVFWQFWETITGRYPRIIKLVDRAYDWQGNIIEHWWTIWIEERVDILWSWSRTNGIDFHLIDYDLGLKYSGTNALELFAGSVDRLSPEDQLCFDQLAEIAEFLKSWTSDMRAEQNRKKLTVIENEQIHDKTDNG